MELTTVYDQVREYYGKTLAGSDDLGTDAPHCEAVPPRTVRTNPLCYSCAAGFGSSCGGSLVDSLE